jgi:MtfA peptidase
MLLGWWRTWRRRRLLSRPVPAAWGETLAANVRQFESLDAAGRQRLIDCTGVLVAEKYWEGCGGLALTDEIRVTIAGQASLLLLGWKDRYFDRLKSILVYPDTYLVPQKQFLPGGVVSESVGINLGESWHQGPVILSWNNIDRRDNPGEPGQNLVLHEFAHVLDHDDDSSDGTPPLLNETQYATWHEVMTAEFRRLKHDARRHRPTLLDPYGTQNPAEFFAVATESFFEQPRELRSEHERLYNLLRDYYCQDPAEWGGMRDKG